MQCDYCKLSPISFSYLPLQNGKHSHLQHKRPKDTVLTMDLQTQSSLQSLLWTRSVQPKGKKAESEQCTESKRRFSLQNLNEEMVFHFQQLWT